MMTSNEERDVRLARLEEKVIRLESQMAAVDYILRGKKKVTDFVGNVQDKMYRLSREVTDRLKSTE